MCLNEKLSYNIKVKSRNCELFVLKKNDFLRLSVNFKEFIEKFLQKSLMKYLRFNEEKKKILKSIDDKNNSVGGIKNINSQSKIGKINDLEMIDEKEEEEVSEEYNIYGSHSDSEEKNEESSEGEENTTKKKPSIVEEKENQSSESEEKNDEIKNTTKTNNILNSSLKEDTHQKKPIVTKNSLKKKNSEENLMNPNKTSKESKKYFLFLKIFRLGTK